MRKIEFFYGEWNKFFGRLNLVCKEWALFECYHAVYSDNQQSYCLREDETEYCGGVNIFKPKICFSEKNSYLSIFERFLARKIKLKILLFSYKLLSKRLKWFSVKKNLA